MKIINLTNTIYTLLILFLLTNSSCNKKNDVSGEKTLINIKTIGIEAYQNVDIGIKSATLNTNNDSKQIIENYPGFDAINEITIQEPISDASKIKSKINNKIAATDTSTLSSDVRYRLLFFDVNNNNNIVVDEIIKVGEFPNITLYIGVPYKWVAYSINESTVPDINSGNVINRDLLKNKDLLYVSGNITLTAGTNLIDLTFKRYTTQYIVNLDVRGMFATLKDDTKIVLANSTKNLFTTANFNILTGEFDPDSYTTATLDGNTMTAIQPNNFSDQTTATFYSISPPVSPINDLKLNFSPLSITMDDGSNRVFQNTTVNLKHAAITNANRGRKYTINTMLVESAIKVGSLNTEWARSNLWYDASNQKGKHRFRVSPFFRDLNNKFTFSTVPNHYLNNILSDINDLWEYKSETPIRGNNTEQVDPCAKVYPLGLWKMPTVTDFDNLPKPHSAFITYRGEPVFEGILNLVGKFGYLELGVMWNSSTVSDAAYGTPFLPNENNSHSKNLYFTGVGYTSSISDAIIDRPRGSSVLDVGSILSVASGISGAGNYWTQTIPTSQITGIPLSIYPYNYRFAIVAGSIASLNVNILRLSVINVGTNIVHDTNYGITTDFKLNIRCVRDPSFFK